MEDVPNLVRQWRAATDVDGQLRCLDNLLPRINSRLYLYLRGWCSEGPELDEVLQETLVNISTTISSFRGASEGEFWTWAFTIARRRAIDRRRDPWGSRALHLTPEEMNALIEDDETTSAALSAGRSIDARRALEILAQLDAGCRGFLTLHFIHGLAYEEIGEIVRKSYDAVRMAITRCLEEARDQFEP